MNLSKSNLIQIALVLVICYFPIFLHLTSIPIELWDESRFAIQALEMTQSGDLLVLTHEGQPDLWLMKPPLMVWMQAALMKVFGYNELAIRLPSALSAFFIVIIMMVFSIRILHQPLVGFLAAITLVVAYGFIDNHVARTGDADALLTLWITLYSLSYFAYLETQKTEAKKPYLILMTMGLIMAFYTKGIAAFLPLPGLLIYTAITKRLKEMMTSRSTYFILAAVSIACLAYYFVRELSTPGYLGIVWNMQIAGNFFNATQHHSHEFTYYLSELSKVQFYPFFYLIPISLLISFLGGNQQLKNFSLYALIFSVSFLLVISFSETKITWYDAPLFPFLSLMIGSGLFVGIKAILDKLELDDIKWSGYAFTFILVASLYYIPYKTIINKVTDRNNYGHWEQEGAFMRALSRSDPHFSKYTVAKQVDYNQHFDQVRFYAKALELEKAFDITFGENIDFSTGDLVMACQQSVLDSIYINYNYKIVKAWEECRLIKILSP